jgi:hypothetical protein
MKLSFKDIQFILTAIDNLIKTYEERINSEDELSDLGDCLFLEALREDLAKKVEPISLQNQNSSHSNLTDLPVQELMQPVLQLPIHQRLVLVDAKTLVNSTGIIIN